MFKFKLDMKDRRILYELDFEARQSLQQIGRKVGLPPDVVHYRIKRLEKEGIITEYSFMVDLGKLGRMDFRVYLKFQHYNDAAKKEIVEYLKGLDKVKWIADCYGAFDMVIGIETTSIHELDDVKDYLFSKIDKYVLEKDIATVVEVRAFRRTYFLGNDMLELNEPLFVMGRSAKTEIDSTDINILKKLAQKGKATIVEIAKELELTPRIVGYRIKELEKKGIILGCRIGINYEKLGIMLFKMLIYLQDKSNEGIRDRLETFKQWCKSHPNVLHYEKIFGNWDIEPEFEVASIEEMQAILADVQNKFSDIIKKIDTVAITRQYKFRYS